LLHILAADYHPAAILHAILVLAKTDEAGLPGAVALATANPAQALALSDRGRLAVGLRADLAIAKHDDSARIVATLSEGEVIYSAGLLAGLYVQNRSAA
jgi:alpha-D-ribose 1-methylphosphonate 5-triphosphate diphosphatase